MAPSSRMTSPLSIGLLTICSTRAPYSEGSAEAAGVWHLRAEGVLCLLRQALQHRGEEQARGDGDDADQLVGEVARDRQGHADDAAFGCGVGGLADLALVGGDRGGVDDDAALGAAVGADRVVGEDALGGAADDVERADQVHNQRLPEQIRTLGAGEAFVSFAGEAPRLIQMVQAYRDAERLGLPQLQPNSSTRRPGSLGDNVFSPSVGLTTTRRADGVGRVYGLARRQRHPASPGLLTTHCPLTHWLRVSRAMMCFMISFVPP